MNKYMENGFATKNFIPNGTIDDNQLRQGVWKDYEVISDAVFIIKNNKPEQLFGKFLMYGEGEFVNGKRNGKWSFYVIEDKTFKKYLNLEVSYVNGSLENEFKYYYSNKTIACQGNYLNNKFEGVVKSYYQDGKVYGIRYYKNGLKNGNHKYLYPNGTVELEHNFVDGIKEGLYQTKYSNGKIQEKFYYKNGKIEGLYQYFYENGQLWIEKIYDNDLLMQVLVSYDVKGNEKDKGTLKDGNGTVKYYDEKGNLYDIITYKDGLEIK
jgi:antitoxin component YwqK of YwqJK toxin-antitoxin module